MTVAVQCADCQVTHVPLHKQSQPWLFPRFHLQMKNVSYILYKQENGPFFSLSFFILFYKSDKTFWY